MGRVWPRVRRSIFTGKRRNVGDGGMNRTFGAWDLFLAVVSYGDAIGWYETGRWP
ncbi:MAG: hypothetical protein JWR26_3453 [Pedosphaera sp.]|nr:hypothetical protein [Pedosphaera sp.]